jgi:hypothetical protein
MHVWFEIKANLKGVIWNVTTSSLVQATDTNVSKKVTASIFREEGSCIVNWRQQVSSKRWYVTTELRNVMLRKIAVLIVTSDLSLK